MDIYTRKTRRKLLLVVAGLAVVGASLVYTRFLASQMAKQERQRIEMLGYIMSLPQLIPFEVQDFDFTAITEYIELTKDIPFILVEGEDKIIDARNFSKDFFEEPDWFQKELESLKEHGKEPIRFENRYIGKQAVYFKDSALLQQLRWFPYVQLSLIGILLAVGYFVFSTARRAEQNRVWVGMAKETAHQLGTPITSLVAWIENLKLMEPDNDNVQMVLPEMANDVDRLRLVADRFSKIGAVPKLEVHDTFEVLENMYQYVKPRASRKININFPDSGQIPLWIKINPLLFDWVIENLLKNALDAMGGKGSITATAQRQGDKVHIDITDTGKGIPRSRYKTVFQPGYSTKKRGWGLGLSLTRRIVVEYHGGKIFVAKSVLNEGTTFRIILPLVDPTESSSEEKRQPAVKKKA